VKRLIFFLFLITLTSIPVAYGIDISTGMIFSGDSGGLVTFSQNFVVQHILLGPTQFTDLEWGGIDYGGFIFDADTGVNVTVIQIADRSITYDVATGIGAPVQTEVSYTAYGAPVTVAGADSYDYNSSTGITTVNSTGASTITVIYGGRHTSPLLLIIVAILSIVTYLGAKR